VKLLQLCKKVPLPPKDGEAVAVLALAKAYRSLGHQVDLLAFNTSKHLVDKEDIKKEDHPYAKIETIYLDTGINYYRAFTNLFSNSSFNIARFTSQKFKDSLKAMLLAESYDIVQLESLYMAPYTETVREHSPHTNVIMRSHNVEGVIWENLAKGSKNPLLKWYYGLCANRLFRYEKASFPKYDLLMAISPSDLERFKDMGLNTKSTVIPVGLDTNEYRLTDIDHRMPLKLGYLGSLDWKPNIEGLLWFFKDVWPAIHKRYGYNFALAGRNPVSEILELNCEGLINRGEVESSVDFLSHLDVVVVPLFSGSGIRVKILESMAMGKIVVSTTKGFEGIDIVHGVHAFVAERPEEYMEVFKTLEDPMTIDLVARNARRFVEEQFDYLNLADKALKNINNTGNEIQ